MVGDLVMSTPRSPNPLPPAPSPPAPRWGSPCSHPPLGAPSAPSLALPKLGCAWRCLEGTGLGAHPSPSPAQAGMCWSLLSRDSLAWPPGSHQSLGAAALSWLLRHQQAPCLASPVPRQRRAQAKPSPWQPETRLGLSPSPPHVRTGPQAAPMGSGGDAQPRAAGRRCSRSPPGAPQA